MSISDEIQGQKVFLDAVYSSLLTFLFFISQYFCQKLRKLIVRKSRNLTQNNKVVFTNSKSEKILKCEDVIIEKSL